MSNEEEYLNGWKRAKADLINYKKEQEKIKETLGKLLMAATISELLKIKDSFDEAFKNPPENNEWASGIKNIKEQLDTFLKTQSLEEIKALGEKFNPEYHESVGEIASTEENDIIMEEVQKGYKLFDRVLRPTKVKINKKINK